MTSTSKLSLPAAIIINLNIMIGAGIFINTIPLAHFAGFWSPFIYLFVGLLMLPLVLGIASLLKIYSGGSFYTFGSQALHPAIGFFSSWSYFTCKLASSMLMIHFFAKIIQSLIPLFGLINVFIIDVFILSIFTLLNMLNMKSGSKIQYTFMTLKLIPILFVILSGILLVYKAIFPLEPVAWNQFFQGIPFGIYAFTGFEASCSLSRHIHNPEKNAPKAILISYALVISILFLYQFFFYSTLGQELVMTSEYIQAFPLLINHVIGYIGTTSNTIQLMLQLAIGCSALGGAYGILFSNNWNLYALAEHGHLFFSKKFTQLNRYNIPTLCILTETFFCLLYLAVTQGNNTPLQQLGALGSTMAYTLSIVALVVLSLRSKNKMKQLIMPLLALINCFILLGFCFYGLFTKSIYPLIAYSMILLFGLCMYWLTSTSKEKI